MVSKNRPQPHRTEVFSAIGNPAGYRRNSRFQAFRHTVTVFRRTKSNPF